MNTNATNPYRHLGGSLPLDDPTYVIRAADEELFQSLQDGEFCYVLNSRQMGKSSLRVRVMRRLQAEGVACGVVDLSAIGTDIDEVAWYKGLAYRILRNFKQAKAFPWLQWWEERSFLSPVQLLSELIDEVLLTAVEDNIVIFIDEIDSVLGFKFSTDDFFSWIRSCYNNRADNPAYRRLTFCLLGVATPSDLIADKKRTPFNIGRAIELNGFEFEQAQAPLMPGLTVENPEMTLRQVLDWTGGQPFLTQKLCQLVVSSGNDVEQVVHARMIENWESQDEPEHLRTIRDRLFANPDRAGRLLGLYQQILEQGGISANDSPEQRELRLTGLTVRKQSQLQVFNPIYASVFDQAWVVQVLADLRPYSLSLDAWVASERLDRSRLLRGTALLEAQTWAQGKSLSDVDYIYLAACQDAEKEDIETSLALEAEAKEVLAVANQKANRRIRLGAGILGLAGLALSSSLTYSGQVTLEARVANEEKSKAEQAVKIARQDQRTAEQAERASQTARQKAIQESIQARSDLQQAKQTLADTKEQTLTQIKAANEQVMVARQQIQKANRDADSAQFQTQQAVQQKRQADQERQQAEVNAAKAKEGANNAQKAQKIAENAARQARDAEAIAIKKTEVALASQEEARLGARLERASLTTIQQFAVDQYAALTAAINVGRDLQMSVDGSQSLSDYPTTSPMLALQTILDNMQHVRRLLGVQPPDIWFSSDGQRYAKLLIDRPEISADDGEAGVFVYHIKGQQFKRYPPVDKKHPGLKIRSVYLASPKILSPLGNRDLIAKDCGANLCIETMNGRPITTLNIQHHHAPISTPDFDIQVAFSPEQGEIITVDTENVVRRWNLSGQVVASLEHQKTVHLSQSGRHWWTYGKKDETVRLWNAQGSIIKTLKRPDLDGFTFSPKGDRIAGFVGGKIQIQDLEGNILERFQAHEPILQSPSNANKWSRSLWFSSDRYLVSTAFDDYYGTTHIWDVEGNQLVVLPAANERRQSFVGFTGQKNRIATLDFLPNREGEFRLWTDAGRELMIHAPKNKEIRHVTFQPQGNLTTTVELNINNNSSKDQVLRIWNGEGQEIANASVHDDIDELLWSPRGDLLATLSKGGKINLWDLNGKNKQSFYVPDTEQWLFHPDGERIFTLNQHKQSYSWSISIWNLQGQQIGKIAGTRTIPEKIWFVPKSNQLAAVDFESNIYRWDLDSFQSVAQKNKPSYGLPTPPYLSRGGLWPSPTGEVFAASLLSLLRQEQLALVNINGQRLTTIIGHTGEIDRVQFSPDGQRIATFSASDRTTRIWNLMGQQIAQYSTADHDGVLAATNADWTKIATIETTPGQRQQSNVKVWPLDSLERLLQRACARVDLSRVDRAHDGISCPIQSE